MPNTTRKRKPLTQLTLEEASGTRKRSKSVDDVANNNTSCPKRAGTINYIILKNFMCHSFLEVKFNNNISMVIGKNGSGKSAILTALVVGLGGKASLTNRGSSVKGFVKAGKSSGSIEIQLNNEGPLAYRSRVYGRTITIIRTLSASGSGSYRIKSEMGETIATNAKEVISITTSLNIQVDNPICILNQDTSRNFLSSNDPKNKFMLFMRATRLEMLEAEYKKIHNNRRDSMTYLEEKEANFVKLQEEIRRLKRKIEGHRSILNLKDKKKLLQLEYLWAKVRDVERELDQENKEAEKIEKKMNDFIHQTSKKTDQAESLRQTNKELNHQVTEVKDQMSIQNQPVQDLKTALNELQTRFTEKKRAKQLLASSIDGKRKDLEELQREINNAQENMSKIEQEKTQRMRDVAALQEKLKGLENVLETSKNDLFQSKSDLSRKQEDEQNLLREIRQIDQKINNERNNLSAIERESGNELLMYGNSMPRVKQAIEKYKNKFQHEPRGPLGSYIKLKDKKWAVAVEGYLGANNLNAFAVDNNKDAQLLRQIFSQVWQDGPQPSVIISKFIYSKHDVSRHKVQVPDGCTSVYDAIGIEDPVVSNCIVDQCGPESVLLFPNDERAIELLSDRRNVPRNCSQGLTIKGDRYYPDPNYKTYASRYHRAKYLQVDTKEYIDMLKSNIESYIRNRTNVQNQLKSLQDDVRQQEVRRQELEEKIRKIMSARLKIKRQYEDMSSAAEPEVQNVHFLEKELEEVKKSINEKTAQLGKATEEAKEIKTKIVEVQEKVSKLERTVRNMEDRIEPLLEQIRENQAKLRELSTSKEFDERRMKEFEKRLSEAKAMTVVKQNTVQKLAEDAMNLGERPAEIREVKEITNEINEVERSIARIETDSENIIEVTTRHNELYEKYKISHSIMKNLRQDVTELSAAVNRRNKHYKLTESFFIAYIKHSFKKILEFRQFKGTIEIKMAEKKLELIVIPQHGSQGLTTTSNLSGGERSFSTVAFLYALWQCMEFPFYFLDEFDVYMDKLNRSKVIDILLHHANSRPELQFVFLTPQDVSFINKDVSILRLQDPERFSK